MTRGEDQTTINERFERIDKELRKVKMDLQALDSHTSSLERRKLNREDITDAAYTLLAIVIIALAAIGVFSLMGAWR